MSSPADVNPPDGPAAPQRSGLVPRWVIMVAALVPLGLFLALLAWGMVRSGGNPGGLGENTSFGEVAVDSRPAFNFVSATLDGQELRLSDSRGKVVMVDFWASWCPSCRQEAPGLAQVYKEYRDREVEFIGVAVWDEPGEVAKYVDRFQVTYPNVIDDRGRIAIEYGVLKVPEKFLIDRNGILVKKFVGPTKPETLRGVLNELLETPAEASSGP